MIATADYAARSAVELAALVHAGEVRPAELLACASARAAEKTAINAIAHIFPAESIAPPPAGAPFAGVPFLVKDIGLLIEGRPMTMGSTLQADLRSGANDTLATRLQAAGLMIFGRTTMAEMGLGNTTNTKAFGITRNPWNHAFNPGGSSGGSAAAVAAGIVPFAHATDGFGSIRIPASHCGVFGFKPSRMRMPLGPLVSEGLAGMSSVHCISRSVLDSAMLLDAVQGADVGDPYAAVPMASCVDAIEAGPRPLRIAYSADAPNGTPVDPAIRAAIDRMAHRLEALGHDVIALPMRYDHVALREALDVISGLTVASGLARALERRGLASAVGLVEPAAIDWAAAAAAWPSDAYLLAVQKLHRITREVGQFFRSIDVFMSPVTAQPPFPADHRVPMTRAGMLDETFTHAPFTGIYNAAGCPAMTVPAGQFETGVPIGAQFGAWQGGESTLYALAAQIERAYPWPVVLPDDVDVTSAQANA